MACACKNKIKKVEKLTEGYEREYSKKGIGRIFFIFASLIGRILIASIIVIIIPFIMIFFLLKIIFFPQSQIVINLDKILKKWRKHIE